MRGFEDVGKSGTGKMTECGPAQRVRSGSLVGGGFFNFRRNMEKHIKKSLLQHKVNVDISFIYKPQLLRFIVQ